MTGVRIGSVKRSYDIIECLTELDEATASQLAEELSIPPTTVLDYLSTLVALGIVVKENHRYRLSLKLLRMGELIRRRDPLYSAAIPVLDDLSASTGETAVVSVQEFGYSVTYCLSKSNSSVDLGLYPGMKSPIHAVATGKVLLAFRPRVELGKILDDIELTPITANTITDRETLREELDRIQSEHIGYNREEYSKGIHAAAAPIFLDDEVRAALAVIGPTGWMNSDRFDIDTVIEGANRVEINLSPPMET